MDELYRTIPEQVKPVEATLQGSLPDWLQGNILRNGPAMFEIGKDEYKHWFDGQGMLHSFNISGGKVKYCSRYLQSQAFALGQKRQGIACLEFGTPVPPPDPCRNIFSRFFSYFVPPDYSDNCAVNVFAMGGGGECYAGSESPFLIGFDPGSLETLNIYDIRKISLGTWKFIDFTFTFTVL